MEEYILSFQQFCPLEKTRFVRRTDLVLLVLARGI